MNKRPQSMWEIRLTRWFLHIVFWFILTIGSGILLLERIPTWFESPFSALFQGFIIIMALFLWGALMSYLILASTDRFFFNFAPLTPQVFFARTFRRIAFGLTLICLVLPIYIIVFSPSELRVHPVLIADMVLLSLLSFLLPLQETLYGRFSITSFFFPTRHLFRTGLGWSVLGLTMISALLTVILLSRPSFQPANASIEAFLRRAMESPAIHAPLLIFSPLTELVLAAQNPYSDILSYCSLALFIALCSISLYRLVAVLRKPRSQSEREAFDAWIKARDSQEKSDSKTNADAASAFDGIASLLHSPHSDRAEPSKESHDVVDGEDGAVEMPHQATGVDLPPMHDESDSHPMPYTPSLAPEQQVSRYFDYCTRVNRLQEGGRSLFASDVNSLSSRMYALLIFLPLAGGLVGSIVQTRAKPCAGWIGVMILLFCTFSRPYSMRWCITSGLLLPLRWPRLVKTDFLHHLVRGFPLDICAAAIIAYLLRSPLWLIPAWWGLFRLAELTAYLRVLLRYYRLHAANSFLYSFQKRSHRLDLT